MGAHLIVLSSLSPTSLQTCPFYPQTGRAHREDFRQVDDITSCNRVGGGGRGCTEGKALFNGKHFMRNQGNLTGNVQELVQAELLTRLQNCF